jgi:hypothetical protein
MMIFKALASKLLCLFQDLSQQFPRKTDENQKTAGLSTKNIFFDLPDIERSRGSSVSIVSDYGLDDRAIGV